VGHLVEALGYKRVRFPMVSLEFFIDIILPAALWRLGWNHPLTQMCTRNIPGRGGEGGKGGRCIRLTSLPPSCADPLEIWQPQPFGTLRACPGLHRDCFTFTLLHSKLCFSSTKTNQSYSKKQSSFTILRTRTT
jgi:hypothetical protein